MKKILLFSIFLMMATCNFANAQLTMHKMIHVGYVYQNQTFGEVGGRLLFLSNDDQIYRVGASALLGVVQEKFAILPKVQGDILLNFEKNVDLYRFAALRWCGLI